jgi:hypothetical protein
MAKLEGLHSLKGKWAGPSRLWFRPDTPAKESTSQAEVSVVAQGLFLHIAYDWEFEGKAQDGVLLIGQEKDGAVRATWVDSFHMQEKAMHLEGSLSEDGVLSVNGSYAAPPGPDWGWRIEIASPAGDALHLTMYNIPPEMEAVVAVRTEYRRVG